MQYRLTTLALGLLFTLLVTAPAWGWGKTGHRVTGAIAERYLSGAARAEVEAILGVEDLAEASTWPDFMRADPDEFWQKTSYPWHWVTVPPGKHYSDVGAPPEGDAIAALARFRRIVVDENASLEERRLALRFIVHLVGDLHQPLHAGNGRDAGGNRFAVTFFGEPRNLHSVWDSGIIDGEQLSYSEMAEWLDRRITPERLAEWQETDPVVWATESTVIRDTIYPPEDERDLRWAYVYAHRDTVRTRLMQGGVRIAAYLNEIFAPGD